MTLQARNSNPNGLVSQMQITSDHLMDSAVFVPSPNFNDRPVDSVISSIVLHCISLPEGQYGTGLPSALFTNSIPFEKYPDLEDLRDLRVSTHLLIDRDGSLYQFVPFDRRAWHAGVSDFKRKSDCNHDSIGIELEGTDTDKYTAAQYSNLASAISTLMQQFPSISFGSICGHSEVAPTRKSDPGSGFDWQRLFKELLLAYQFELP